MHVLVLATADVFAWRHSIERSVVAERKGFLRFSLVRRSHLITVTASAPSPGHSPRRPTVASWMERMV